jgi:hypothetical protein
MRRRLMPLQVLDPTNETAPRLGQLAPRLDGLAGKTIGFISNGKEGTRPFRLSDRPARATWRRADGDAGE